MSDGMIRARILSIMERRGMSISELAEIAGVHRARLSMWLAGKCDTNVATAERVMRALGVRVCGGR